MGQLRVRGEELVPPRFGIVTLPAREVGGEVLDVDLDARSVRSKVAQGHASLFPDQERLVSIGTERDLDRAFVGLSGLGVGVAHRQPQASRRFARLHAPGACPPVEERGLELSAQA